MKHRNNLPVKMEGWCSRQKREWRREIIPCCL